MEADRITALEQRVAALERRIDKQMQPLIDRIDADVGDVDSVITHFIVPSLLRMGGWAHRQALLDYLATLAVELDALRDVRTNQNPVLRVAHWRKLARSLPEWAGGDGNDWMRPEPETP